MSQDFESFSARDWIKKINASEPKETTCDPNRDVFLFTCRVADEFMMVYRAADSKTTFINLFYDEEETKHLDRSALTRCIRQKFEAKDLICEVEFFTNAVTKKKQMQVFVGVKMRLFG